MSTDNSTVVGGDFYVSRAWGSLLGENCKSPYKTLIAAHCVVAGAAVGYLVFKHGTRNNILNLIVRATRRIHDKGFRKLAFGFSVRSTGYVAPSGHTHPVAAKIRNDVVVSIRDVLTESGYKMYDPSPARAARDKRYNLAGHRHVHSIKDLGADLPLRFGIPEDSVVTLIDQDFHLTSLDEYGGHPIVIYTMCTDSLSGVGCDSTWYYVDVNLVLEEVNGGACYMQSLFNYSSDQVAIPHRTCYGLWPSFTVYDIHIYRVPNTNKMVVFLCPSSTHYMPLIVFRGITLLCNHRAMDIPLLTRYNGVQRSGLFLVMKGEKSGCVGYFIKRNNDQAHDSTVFMPEGAFKALVWVAQSSQTKILSVAEVERLTRAYGFPITGISLATVIEFLALPYLYHTSLNVYRLPSTSHGDLMHDYGKPKAELIIPPIVEEVGVVLMENEAARRSYVEERLTPNVNLEVFSDDMKRYAEEYVKQMIRAPGKCVPSTMGDVVEDQTGRLQKARNKKESKFESNDKKRVVVALKAEVAVKVGPARGVSTVTTQHSIDTGRLSRGIKPALKKSKHYMVGSAPRVIADAVSNLAKHCRDAGVLVGETDYSKLDETISLSIREHLVEAVFLRAFAREHHELVRSVLDYDKECTGYVGDIKIKTGGKNNSGSGLTTDINQITAPFPIYVTHRQFGKTQEEAFGLLGVAFGDDGLSVGGKAGEFSAACVANAAAIGLKLKYIEHECTEPLYFLGRLYLDPLTSPVSMAKPSRVLRRLPVCIGKAEEHRADRLRGYYVTEKHVPIVAEYIEAAARAYKIDDLREKPELTQALRERDRDLYYRLSHGPYPYSQSDDQLLVDAVCKDLAIQQSECEELRAKLREVTTVKDFEGLVLPMPPIEGLDTVMRF